MILSELVDKIFATCNSHGSFIVDSNGLLNNVVEQDHARDLGGSGQTNNTTTCRMVQIARTNLLRSDRGSPGGFEWKGSTVVRVGAR